MTLRPGSRVAVLVLGVAAAIAAAILWPERARLRHLGDDFVIPLAAQRWADGELPYRDFSEFVAPLPILLERIALQTLGPTSTAAHALPVASSILIVALVALVGWRVAGTAGAVGAGLWALLWSRLAFGLCAHHHQAGHALALAALLPWLGRDAPAKWTVFAAGAAIGACLVTRQHLAATVFLASAAALRLDPRLAGRRVECLVALAAGSAALPLALLIGFAASGGGAALVRDTLAWPATQYLPFNWVAYPAFEALLGLWPASLSSGSNNAILGFVGAAVPAAAVLAGALTFRWRPAAPAAVWTLAHAAAWAGAAMLHPRTMALGWASVLLIVPAVWGIRSAWARTTAWRVAAGAVVAAAIPSGGVLLIEQSLDVVAFRTHAHRTWAPARGVWIAHGTDTLARCLAAERLAAHVPGEPLLFYPYLPGAHFCLARPCAVRRSVLLPQYVSDREMSKVGDSICDGSIRAAIVEPAMLRRETLSRYFPQIAAGALDRDPVLRAIERCLVPVAAESGLVLFRPPSGTAPRRGP